MSTHLSNASYNKVSICVETQYKRHTIIMCVSLFGLPVFHQCSHCSEFNFKHVLALWLHFLLFLYKGTLLCIILNLIAMAFIYNLPFPLNFVSEFMLF